MRKISTLPNSGTDTVDYPFGYIIDAGGAVPGTPVVEQTYSDVIQSILHFLSQTGTIPNGLKDNTTNGFQIFNAIEKYLDPVGTIKLWPSLTIPDGWMFCDGRYLMDTENPELFSLIGTTYGSTNATAPDGLEHTFFKIPNFGAKYPIGYNSNQDIGYELGSSEVTLYPENIPAHKHGILGISGGDDNNNNNTVRFAGGDKGQSETGFFFTNTSACQETGQGAPFQFAPPSLIIGFIIKISYNQVRL